MSYHESASEHAETDVVQQELAELRTHVAVLKAEVAHLRRAVEATDSAESRPRLAVLEHRTESLRNDHTKTDRRLWNLALMFCGFSLLVVIALQVLLAMAQR